ncbi:MAG: hypothetical protein QOG27_1163 [Verrucomicrobiota bacterium]|jgi:hypothetical protein
MKPFLTILIVVASLHGSVAATRSASSRTLKDIDAISTRVLQRSISPKFYKSLLISPIQGWILVRANIAGTHLSGPRIIHSELNGAYDSLALKLASEAQIAGYFSIEQPHYGGSVLLHLLIYQIADGTMALSFPAFEEPGGDQMEYWGCARLAVLKSNGKWTEIEGPASLQGKGWEVRQGLKSRMRAILKAEMKPLNVDG